MSPFSIPAVINIVPESAKWREDSFQGLIFTSMFQPVFNAHSGKVFGYEALARAYDAQRRAKSTAEVLAQFCPETMFEADMFLRRLHLENFGLVDDGSSTVMINMTPSSAVRELEHPHDLINSLQAGCIDGRRVCIELLEHETADEHLLEEVVKGYRQLGCLVAIDDFGIGASKFERVDLLKPDIVKIDRHLLMDAVSNRDARQVLPWLIELLHRQGARALIEGIEDIGEALVAIESGADYLQGYYLAMPKPSVKIDPLSERIVAELIRMGELESDHSPEALRSYHPEHPKSAANRAQWEAVNPRDDNRAAILQLMRDFLSAYPNVDKPAIAAD